jgi:hypothetical protein
LWAVQGGGSAAPAGVGAGWYATHVRMERQTVGTLIENGQITTAHIAAAGIDGGSITAGTVTGDRMQANFIDSETFSTIHTSGQPFVDINGKSNTVGGHVNGPFFRVNDGTFNRVIMGRLQDDWGLWIYDASGNPFFQEATLANGVVVTGHVKPGNITAAASASVANGPFGNGGWQVAASSTVTLYDSAIVVALANVLLGYSSGSRTWGLKLTVDGSDVALTQPGVANTQTGLAISWSGTLSGSSGGTSHTVTLSWNADSTVQIDGGTLSILGLQR